MLRGLRLVYSKNGNKPITNLYIQLDNTNYNKGYGLLSALASLVQNGIVKKVSVCINKKKYPSPKLLLSHRFQIKISYLIVGHTHADVDALIGTIVSYLRNVDQMSPEEFSEAVGRACSSANGTIDGIQNTLSTHDYESNFKSNILRKDVEGITEAKEIRLSYSCGDYVEMLYKVFYFAIEVLFLTA